MTSDISHMIKMVARWRMIIMISEERPRTILSLQLMMILIRTEINDFMGKLIN
jgi:hypothetical protein